MAVELSKTLAIGAAELMLFLVTLTTKVEAQQQDFSRVRWSLNTSCSLAHEGYENWHVDLVTQISNIPPMTLGWMMIREVDSGEAIYLADIPRNSNTYRETIHSLTPYNDPSSLKPNTLYLAQLFRAGDYEDGELISEASVFTSDCP